MSGWWGIAEAVFAAIGLFSTGFSLAASIWMWRKGLWPMGSRYKARVQRAIENGELHEGYYRGSGE